MTGTTSQWRGGTCNLKLDVRSGLGYPVGIGRMRAPARFELWRR